MFFGYRADVGSNVTLDLNGYQIICTGSCSRGVDFNGHSATIDGPGVIDGFDVGVYGGNVAGTTVHGLAVLNSTDIGIDEVDDVARNLISGIGGDGATNDYGIVAGSAAQFIDDNVITSTDEGIHLSATPSTLKIRRNTVSGNYTGIFVTSGSDCNDGSTASINNSFVNNSNADVMVGGVPVPGCIMLMSKNLCITSGNYNAAQYPCGTSQLLTSWGAYDPTP